MSTVGEEGLVEEIARKDALLEAILPEIAFEGWSRRSLQNAARVTGFDSEEIRRLFPGGVIELARWLDDWADRQMADHLGQIDLSSMKIRHRVTLGIRARLEILTPHREAVRRAIALNCSPLGTANSLRAIGRTIDTIWVLAGDTATDFNYFSKRGLLAAVYASTLLFWLDDNSDGQERSWAFLNRRIDDIMKIPTATARLKTGLRRLVLPLKAFRRTA